MIEGWHNDSYLILFDKDEIGLLSDSYRIATHLPGYTAIGIRDWDDLIVRDESDALFTVPTVPLTSDYLTPFSTQFPDRLDPDSRFLGKIKWYVKLIVFGGDPGANDNVTWVDHSQHAQLVRWWNEQYRALKAQASDA
jgi:hypothetical protein